MELTDEVKQMDVGQLTALKTHLFSQFSAGQLDSINFVKVDMMITNLIAARQLRREESNGKTFKGRAG